MKIFCVIFTHFFKRAVKSFPMSNIEVDCEIKFRNWRKMAKE